MHTMSRIALQSALSPATRIGVRCVSSSSVGAWSLRPAAAAAAASAKGVRRATAAAALGIGATTVAFISTHTAHSSSAQAATPAASTPAATPAAAAGSASSAAAAAQPFDLTPFRNFKNLDDFRHNQDIVLYQYETCPFCNKVRAYLDFCNIRYRAIEVNPLTKAEKKAAGGAVAASKAVPVLVVNGVVMLDSTPIIKRLHEIQNLYRAPEARRALTPEEEAGLTFVDERFVPLTAPNLYRSWDEAVESFEYISRNSQLAANSGPVNRALTKYVGAASMYLIAEYKLKKKYNIQDPRADLYKAAREWSASLGGRPFRGGVAGPDVADVSAYGVVRALQGYAAGRDIMNVANVGPEFVQWYERMDGVINKNKAV